MFIRGFFWAKGCENKDYYSARRHKMNSEPTSAPANSSFPRSLDSRASCCSSNPLGKYFLDLLFILSYLLPFLMEYAGWNYFMMMEICQGLKG